jgi:hypothetical protein
MIFGFPEGRTLPGKRNQLHCARNGTRLQDYDGFHGLAPELIRNANKPPRPR